MKEYDIIKKICAKHQEHLDEINPDDDKKRLYYSVKCFQDYLNELLDFFNEEE